MVAKSDIIKFLEDIEIKHDDTVLIHTSLKAIGGLDGGADMLIDAFCEYLYDGLFLIPTHTWDDVLPDKPFYDVKTTMPCIGTLPCVAVNRKDGVRSLHPTHSVMAFGKRAREFIKGEEMATSPASIGGCWSRLYDEHAKILLIGVGHDKNTYFHAVDEMLHIPNRLREETYTITIMDEDGNLHTTPPFRGHYTKGISTCCSDFYPNYKKPLEELGAVTYARLGDALVYCCDAVKCFHVIQKLWERTDHDLCIREEEIPTAYYKEHS
jgi:aminoglycoside 3-N-acetyltransferase